jgi:hypothetical protein
VEFALSERIVEDGTVLVITGTHGISSLIGCSGRSLELKGINVAEGAAEMDYPGVYPSEETSVWFELNLSEQTVLFENMRVFYPSSGFVGCFITALYDNNRVEIINCFVYMENVDSSIGNAVLVADYGYWHIYNNLFHNFTLDKYGIIDSDLDSDHSKFELFNNSFLSLTIAADSAPAVISINLGTVLNITGDSYIDIAATSINAVGAVLNLYRDSNCLLDNLSFINITGSLNPVYFFGTTSISQSNFLFENVTSENEHGGAVVLDVYYSDSVNYTFVQSTFKSCSSKGFGGLLFVCGWDFSCELINVGAIYSHGVAVVLDHCKFYENTAGAGYDGNDVYIDGTMGMMLIEGNCIDICFFLQV